MEARILDNGESLLCNFFFAGWDFWTNAELTMERNERLIFARSSFKKTLEVHTMNDKLFKRGSRRRSTARPSRNIVIAVIGVQRKHGEISKKKQYSQSTAQHIKW